MFTIRNQHFANLEYLSHYSNLALKGFLQFTTQNHARYFKQRVNIKP